MKPNELQELFDKALYECLSREDVSVQDIEKLSSRLEETMPNIVDDIVDLLYRSLSKIAPSMLRERRAFLKGFQKRHYKLWKKGLNLLEAYLVVAYEIGENFNKNYREDASRVQDYVFEALTRLHARAVHIGFEVLTLLFSGFADGAHARWRTAHEIAVVANFLASHGGETAKRYLEHEVIESYKAMVQFQDYAEALGYEGYSDEELFQTTALRDRLCAQYGKEFGTVYGWAAEALSNQQPKLSDIEKASGMDHLRPYYRMASHNVHANPKGIRFRLGLSDRSELLLAGPSNYGLPEPAHGIAISVLQVTIPMLNTKMNIDTLVMAKIMQKYVDDIGVAFLETDRAMKSEDKA